MLFVTVYGGALLGSYTVDRISQALPSLSARSTSKTGDHCILIVNQHQFASPCRCGFGEGTGDYI